MEEILLKIFPVQSKSYSGFFRVSTNTTPYTLILTKNFLSLRFLGIPFVKIAINDIISYKAVGDEWVTTQKVFNGVVIKYRRGNKTKERVITFFNKEKSLEFLKVLKKATGK
jgi:hypothetical protein